MNTSAVEQELKALNIRIGVAESEGDEAARKWLGDVVAPFLGFRRAGKTFAGRDEYLQAVAASDRRDTTVEAIDIYGERAVVRCIVTVQSTAGPKRYHNLRLFVKHDGQWKLLGWANEAL